MPNTSPKKLFEVKFGEWEKSLSYETTVFVNGIFKTFSNCDPFVGRGAFVPTNAVSEIGSGVVDPAESIRVILPIYASGSGQFYALGDNYKAYLVDSSETVTDVSAQVGTGSAAALDMKRWKNGVAYAMSTEVRTNAIPLASGSDTQVLSVNPTSNLCIGPDRDLYIGVNNNVAYVRQAGGTGTAVAASLETGNIVKKLISDSRYLLWVAYNGSSPNGRDQIILAWWNLSSSAFDDIQEFEGGSLRGAEKVGNDILILTTTGIYLTRFGAGKPQLIVPFGGSVGTTDVPVSDFFMGSEGCSKNTLFWGTNGSTGRIFAYGNPVANSVKRLYQMGTSPDTNITALNTNNSKFLFATSGNTSVGTRKFYSLSGSSSINTAIANLAGFSLGKPYIFHSARVVLKSPVASGNSVSLQILTSNSTKTVCASATKTNSTDSGERNLVFRHTAAGDGSDVRTFEDLSDVKLTTNVAIHSLALYGFPVDERGSYA